MKKSLLTLAVLGFLSGTACAQNSTVPYGTSDADSAESSIDAADEINSIGGLHSPGRIGFRGAEDLGGGLSAVFTFENSLRSNYGAAETTPGSTLYGRQAYIGLQNSFGTFRIGRQYNPLYNATSPLDPFGVGLTGDYTRLISPGGAVDARRLDSSIGYVTPNTLGGFRLEGMYSAGDHTGGSLQVRQIGFNAGYANGPAYVVVAHHDTKDFTGENSLKNTAVGGTYTFDHGIRLSGLYQVNRNGSLVDTRDWLVGVTVPFGANTFMASYIRHINRTMIDSDSDQFSLGYSYSLTKRTNIYTSWSRLSNDSNSLLRWGRPGDVNNLFNAGIRHQF